MATIMATPDDSKEALPFRSHEINFLRVALNLRYRAEIAGIIIAPNDLCAGRRYGVSHARRYEVALGDEPKEMVTKSILDIIASTPPDAFSQLWEDDVHSHFQFRSRFKEGVTV